MLETRRGPGLRAGPDAVERLHRRRASGRLLFTFLAVVCLGTAVVTLVGGGINPAGIVTGVVMGLLAAACLWRAWFARRGKKLDPWRDPDPLPDQDVIMPGHSSYSPQDRGR